MRIVGQEQVAAMFGVAPKTIVEWQEQGLPVALRGGPGVPSEYESEACITWLVNREVAKASGGETQRDRVFRLQGDALELELAEKRGLLIPAALVEPRWTAVCVAAREQLLRERRRLAAMLDGVADRQQRELIIGQAHEAFLRKLAAWRAGEEVAEEAAVEP